MRQSGIFMHITSLPSPYGVGTLGKDAYEFVDFLKAAGQQLWQILPLSPTGYGDSPYQSCSSFAGNPYLIDLDLLVEEGLLQKQELEQIQWSNRADRVNFGTLYAHRFQVLRLAYSRFADKDALDSFCRDNGDWLPDYALYVSVKEQTGGLPWYQWDAPLKCREPEAMWQTRQKLKDEIRFHCFVQYLFFKQWDALHSYARENGVCVFGDVPIYVPYDSADVWSAPELFLLDEDYKPVAVSGCPPDAFSQDGQLWGNPLYRWDVMKKDGYSWWLRRLAAAGRLYDRVRLDHFRGLESYWAVPYGDETARNGKWCLGPGMDFIRTLQKKLPQLNMVAEDLGFLTPQVRQLLAESGYPGMKVLEFAFDSPNSDYLPHYYDKNSVCYLGTHDNMTAKQWLETAGEDTLSYARDYMHLTPEEGFVWGMIRTAFASVSDLCIIQMQDYLQLGAQARMNFPGTQSEDNWSWRAEKDFTSPELAQKIYHMTMLYGRLGDRNLP